MHFSLATFTLAAIVSAAAVSGAILDARAADVIVTRAADGGSPEAFTSDAEAGQSFDSISKGSFSRDDADSLMPPEVLYACSDYNFNGNCWYIGIPLYNQCYNTIPERDNIMSSLAVMYTNIGCFVYTERGCAGEAAYIDYSSGYVGVLPSPFDNSVSSFKCIMRL